MHSRFVLLQFFLREIWCPPCFQNTWVLIWKWTDSACVLAKLIGFARLKRYEGSCPRIKNHFCIFQSGSLPDVHTMSAWKRITHITKQMPRSTDGVKDEKLFENGICALRDYLFCNGGDWWATRHISHWCRSINEKHASSPISHRHHKISGHTSFSLIIGVQSK